MARLGHGHGASQVRVLQEGGKRMGGGAASGGRASYPPGELGGMATVASWLGGDALGRARVATAAIYREEDDEPFTDNPLALILLFYF